MSTEGGYKFKPDYAVHPGDILEERLEVWGMSQAEFARRCGRSTKLISQIIAGKAPITAATALRFEKATDLDAIAWLNMESSYRLHLARQKETRFQNAEETASV